MTWFDYTIDFIWVHIIIIINIIIISLLLLVSFVFYLPIYKQDVLIFVFNLLIQQNNSF